MHCVDSSEHVHVWNICIFCCADVVCDVQQFILTCHLTCISQQNSMVMNDGDDDDDDDADAVELHCHVCVHFVAAFDTCRCMTCE